MPAEGSGPGRGRELAEEFFARVWNPPHDLDAIDELMTPDYQITTAGEVIAGRARFKAWVAEVQTKIVDAANEHVELFSDATGERVVSRFITRGRNNGIFGLQPTRELVAFSGIAIWRVAGGRLAECWVERSAHELYLELTST